MVLVFLLLPMTAPAYVNGMLFSTGVSFCLPLNLEFSEFPSFFFVVMNVFPPRFTFIRLRFLFGVDIVCFFDSRWRVL